MLKGSQPTDGGHLVLTDEERRVLLRTEPGAKKWIRSYIGTDELLYDVPRFCLWLKGITPAELNKLPLVKARVGEVKKARLKSPTKSVREDAERPTLFTQDRQPSRNYLAVPEVSSEARRFIPIAFLTPEIVPSNKIQMVVDASLYHFGVMTSTMHMAWVRHVCGRLESRFSYSPSIYNNFPWPQPTAAQLRAIENAAQGVLDARAGYPDSSLADLYEPLAMPPELVKAHGTLDKTVDKAYRPQAFENDRIRIEYLFQLFEAQAVPLLPPALSTPKGRKKRA